MNQHRLILLATLWLGCGARSLGLPDEPEPTNMAAAMDPAERGPDPSTHEPVADCLAAPLACARGSVCARDTDASFHCLPPGPRGHGEPCATTAVAPCGEGLVCAVSPFLDTGFCYPWCELQGSTCPSGSACRLIDAGSGRQGPVCVAEAW